MNISTTADLTHEQRQFLYQLWNEEYPANIGYGSVEELNSYLDGFADIKYLLLTDDDGSLTGWASLFVREGEVWFAIILKKGVQGKGYGTRLLNELKRTNASLAGWVVDHNNFFKANGKPYRPPIDFYLKNGFAIQEGTRLETEKLSAAKIVWQAPL